MDGRNRGRHNALMAQVIFAPVHPELKKLAGEAADRENLPLNEFVARILASHLGRPDLAQVPRKKMGRPRKVS